MTATARSVLAMLAALGAAVICPSTAIADRAVLILGGDLTHPEEAPLRAAAVDAVRTSGWSVIDFSLSPSSVTDLLVCVSRDISDDEGCVNDLFKATRADRAVLLRVRNSRYQGQIVREMTGWVFRPSGKALTIGQRFCNACREGGLETTVQFLVTKLIRSARAQARPSRLIVQSTPSGAMVRLNGKAVGVTEMDFSVYPGSHVVELTKKGFHVATREVTVDDGERVAVEVTLQPLDGASRKPVKPPESNAPTPKPRVLPWVVIGAGAAGMVTGGVLLAVDQNESGPEGVRELKYDETTTVGLSVGAAGAVAVGVGVYLLFRAKPTTPVPVASVGQNVAWFGVRGAF